MSILMAEGYQNVESQHGIKKTIKALKTLDDEI
jgi:hypothetical protein